MKTSALILLMTLIALSGYGQSGLDPIQPLSADSVLLPVPWVQKATKIIQDHKLLLKQYEVRSDENRLLREALQAKVLEVETKDQIITNKSEIITTQKQLTLWQKLTFGIGGVLLGFAIGSAL